MADEYANSSHTLEELEKTIELTLDPNKGLEKFGYCFKGSILLSKGTNDYTELDSYNSINHLGLYFLYRQVEPALVGFLKIYWTWGGTIVQELESFKMSGVATAMQHTTIMVRWKYTTGSWSEWKSYQKSFIGSDKILGGNWTDEDVAPSLKEFNEAVNTKVVRWSGKFVDDAEILSNSYPEGEPANIVFVKSASRFAYLGTDGKYFDNWTGRDDYFTGNAITHNYFLSLYGDTWVFDKVTGISQLAQRIYYIPGDVRTLNIGTIDPQGVFGNASDLINAIAHNMIIMSGNVMLQVVKYDYNPQAQSIIELYYVKGISVVQKNIEYLHINLTILRGNTWTDCNSTQILVGGN